MERWRGRVRGRLGRLRPHPGHDVDVVRRQNGRPTVPAAARHINMVGPVVRVDLDRADHLGSIEAVRTRERYEYLALQPGETVFVAPKKVQVFLEDYSI